MASTVLDPTADTIVSFLQANGFNAYKWARLDYDLPAGVVELPRVSRRQGGSQLGSLDWDMAFQIALYFPLEEAAGDQAAAAEKVEAFIQAVDENPSLSDPTIVEDAVVTGAEPDFDTEGARPMIVYVVTLELTKLVPQ